MPEGDTVHRIARVLDREITGRAVDAVTLRDRGEVRDLVGRQIDGVEAIGKHMFVHFGGGWSLRVHLGMYGRWRRLHVRQRRPAKATVTLVVGNAAYVCQRAYTAETVRTADVARHPRIARLGPDLLAEPAPVTEAVRRAAMPSHARREIGDLLLDQRVAAGIGNVYKSEALFECRVHPSTPVGCLPEETLHELLATAARQLRANLHTRRRTTVPLERRARPADPRLWVYGRAGEPCLECGATLERFLQGDMARSTYFCPLCQTR